MGFLDSESIKIYRTANCRVRFEIFDGTEDSSYQNIFINEEISIKKIKYMLRTAKNTSAGTSPDQLPYILLKNMTENGFLLIKFIFSSIWSKHIFPDDWHEALVIPVPKPDKDLPASIAIGVN